MSAKAWIVIGALCGAVGVSAGAIGAHALESALRPEEGLEAASLETRERYERRIENFDVAAKYQLYHAPALVLVGLLVASRPSRWFHVAGWLFLIGVVLFSGFLYAWVLSQTTWFVHVVPFGGTALILGWIALGLGALQSADRAAPLSER